MIDRASPALARAGRALVNRAALRLGLAAAIPDADGARIANYALESPIDPLASEVAQAMPSRSAMSRPEAGRS